MHLIDSTNILTSLCKKYDIPSEVQCNYVSNTNACEVGVEHVDQYCFDKIGNFQKFLRYNHPS